MIQFTEGLQYVTPEITTAGAPTILAPLWASVGDILAANTNAAYVSSEQRSVGRPFRYDLGMTARVGTLGQMNVYLVRRAELRTGMPSVLVQLLATCTGTRSAVNAPETLGGIGAGGNVHQWMQNWVLTNTGVAAARTGVEVRKDPDNIAPGLVTVFDPGPHMGLLVQGAVGATTPVTALAILAGRWS
jgi:hypothetical protein